MLEVSHAKLGGGRTLSLEDLVRETVLRQTRVFEPQGVEVDDRGRYFNIRPFIDYPLGRFGWVNQLEGPASEAVDFCDKGPVSFVSDRLLAILREFDPEAIDAVPAPLKCGTDTLGFNAFMPMHSFVAGDLTTPPWKSALGRPQP